LAGLRRGRDARPRADDDGGLKVEPCPALIILMAMTATMSSEYADFFKNSTKAENDAANKRREAILLTLYDIELPSDTPAPIRNLQESWRTTIRSLCPMEFSTVKVIKKGGRSNNYDFFIEYFSVDGRPIYSQKAEFKHGASSIEAQPQFLSLASKGLLFPLSYPEFYYDGYLTAYCASDTSITESLPARDDYLARIHGCDYDTHPFFRTLYDRELTNKKAKATVVNQSIRAYLEAYGDKCDVAQLTAKLLETQADKVFLLWDMRAAVFHVARLTATDLTPTEYRGVDKGNTIVYATETYLLKLLLRWKNHKGILYPAWQISLKRR